MSQQSIYYGPGSLQDFKNGLWVFFFLFAFDDEILDKTLKRGNNWSGFLISEGSVQGECGNVKQNNVGQDAEKVDLLACSGFLLDAFAFSLGPSLWGDLHPS